MIRYDTRFVAMCQTIILGDVYLTDCLLFLLLTKENMIIQADRKSKECWVSDVLVNFQSAPIVSPSLLSLFLVHHILSLFTLTFVFNTNKEKRMCIKNIVISPWIIREHSKVS